jgi:hypothetical protein
MSRPESPQRASVLAAVRACGGLGVTVNTLVRMTGLYRSSVRKQLAELARRRLVVRSEPAYRARWTAISAPLPVVPRPVAVQPAVIACGGREYVVAWSGTRERAGHAPSLSSFGREPR